MPLLKDAQDGLVTELSNALTLELCFPGDYVVKKGEVGEEMFFIREGTLDVIIHVGEKTKKVAEMSAGTFFGEIALANDGLRTATIQAQTYCELLVLTKDKFMQCTRLYGDLHSMLGNVANARLKRDKARKHMAVVRAPLDVFTFFALGFLFCPDCMLPVH